MSAFGEMNLGRLLGNMVPAVTNREEKINIQHNQGDHANFMMIDLKQIKEQKRDTNYQQRLRQIAENYDFFHLLCRLA